MHHDISFDAQNILRSEQFGDIYFSPDDGLAETQYVFLKANNLPQAWQKQSHFTIAETGFGTGLNILSAWKLFEETTSHDQYLDLISVEKYPLKSTDILRALKPFRSFFGKKIDRLINQYPLITRGIHRLWLSDRVTLTLIFDDAAMGLSFINHPIDAWFLDGFAPSKNPDMWCGNLFKEIARLSHVQTTLGTFTAAGLVKRSLEQVGFKIEKIAGFGRKREMITGHYICEDKKQTKISPKNIAVIGGGLAGTATAFCLKRRGLNPIIFEKEPHIAHGASSNQCALINPKLHADYHATQTQLCTTGYSFLLKQLQNIPDIDFAQMGSIHLAHTEQKLIRFQKLKKNLNWPDQHMRLLSQKETSDKIGQYVEHSGVFYPDAAMVNPQKLCQHYAREVEIRTNQDINLQELNNFDVVVIANGIGALSMPELSSLPLRPIRGQVTYINDNLFNLPHSISYGGYISASNNGQMVVGSSFDKASDQPIIKKSDDQENLEKLYQSLPQLRNKNIELCGHWAGIRCASKDYLPVIGTLPHQNNVYTHLALGSHGTVTSLIGAEILASMITGGVLPINMKVEKALSAKRFKQ